LGAVALYFNPKSDKDEEVKLIMRRLDRKKVGVISQKDWVDFLMDLFQFMKPEAFEKHCEELMTTIKKAQVASSGQ
jgi:hypothetical protein